MHTVKKLKTTPKGIRIPVTSVKGKCPRPLDDGGLASNYILLDFFSFVNFFVNYFCYLIFSIHIGIFILLGRYTKITIIKMCTEFLLAIIYFVTIFLVNYFLSKLLATYSKNIFYLLRLKTIFKSFKKSNNNLIFLLFSFVKKEKKNSAFLGNLHKVSKTKDLLIIGNTYKYLSKNLKYQTLIDNKVYYFELLANHYLSAKKEKI
jgi:hypothetical protein